MCIVLSFVRKGRKKHWLMMSCLVVAILLHGLLFSILFGFDILKFFENTASSKVRERKEDLSNEIIVELEEMVIAELMEQTEVKLEVPAELEEAIEEEREKKFLRTSEEQLSGIPESDSAAEGKRNTIAASNAPSREDAPAVAAQQGEEKRYEGDLRTVRGDFSDGTIGSLAARSEAGGSSESSVVSPLPEEDDVKPPEEAVKNDEEEDFKPEKSPEVKDSKPSQRSTLASHLASDLKTDVNPFKRSDLSDDKSEQAQSAPIADEGRQPSKDIKEKSLPSARQGVAEREKQKSDSAKLKGFESGGQTTKLLGSISRKSAVSSQDVVASPLGRYQAAVSQAIEREWMVNCTKYREFINPGVITIRFYIDDSGNVRKARFMDIVEGSEIQKGFTLQSVKKAKIPSMPAQVKQDQRGEPLELIYNFIF